MGTQQQENSPRNQPNPQQGTGKQTNSPRSDGEIGQGGQDAGTIGSSSGQDNRQPRDNRDKSKS